MEGSDRRTVLSKTDEVVLKNVKQQLMSRNVKLQMEAVIFITRSLKADVEEEGRRLCQMKTLQDILLDADITEFLCEAMATVHTHLLEAIFACLEHLANCKKFYDNSHVLYVVECLIRAVHFLTKQNNSCHTLNRALSLLSGLFKGFIKFTGSKALQMGAFNVSQVLEMIRSVLSNKCNTWNETVICVSWVLSNLAEARNFMGQLDVTALQLFVTVLESCITLLSAFVKNHKAVDQKVQSTRKEAVSLMNYITLSAVRLCSALSCGKMLHSRADTVTDTQYDLVITRYIRKIADVLLECVQVVIAPYILEMEMKLSNMELFCQFLCCLKAMYYEHVKEFDTFQLSHHLGELGYLTFLPVISTWCAHNSKDGCSLSSMCTSVLGELLCSMSASVLDVDDLWPGGLTAFRKHLQTGLEFLPIDCAFWLKVLHTQDAPHSLQHAVIVFIYFFCLCASIPDIGTPCLPAIVSYLNHLPSIALVPVPITKAMWFVFAVSSLSYSGPVRTEQATRVLLQLLGQQIHLRNVYTHHPAILYWVFSSPWIHPSIQKEVMTMWLEEDQYDCKKDMMDLVMMNYDASSCLMELIQCGKPQVVKRAVQIMQDAILHQFRDGKDDLIQTLWDIIPQSLARFSTCNSSLQATKVGGLMHLACMAVPSNLSALSVLRAACLLMRMLANQGAENSDTPLAFHKAAICHAFLLLLVSMELQDKRILAIYISEPKFLNVLHTAMESKHPTICSTAVHFLSHLLHYQMTLENFSCDHIVRIDTTQVHQLLMNPDFDVLSACLQLIFNLLQSKLAHPVIRLSEKGQDVISSEFLQTLFIKLQSLSIKNVPGISKSSWKCLGALLQFCSTHFVEPNIQMHLATQPWTYFLIRSMMHTFSILGSYDFLYFIYQWLLCIQSCRTTSRFKMVRLAFKKERALCPVLFSETLMAMATMFLNCDLTTMTASTKELVQHIMTGILESGIYLSEDICKSLRHCLLQVQSRS